MFFRVKNKKKLYIVFFVAVLVAPWVLGGFFRLLMPKAYESMTSSNREKRDKNEIEWSRLLDTCESVSDFVDDRIPFRNFFISCYQHVDQSLSQVYQTAANNLLTKLYPVAPEPVTASKEKKAVVENELPKESNEAETAEDATRNAPEYVMPVIKGQTLEGRDGWLFLAGEDELMYYGAANIMSDEQMASYAATVKKLDDICKSQGKEFYFMITPNKTEVYDRYMPSFEVPTNYKRIQRFYDYLLENTGVQMLYPLPELMTAADQMQVYYKYDTHWNLAGAFVGTQCLYQAMGLPVSDISDWTGQWEETDEMDLCDLGFIPRDSVEPDFDYYFDYKPQVEVSGLDLDAMVCRTRSNSENKKSLAMISDSYRVNMEPFISKDFANATIAHRDYISSIKSDIKKADIIVVSIVERYDYEAFNAMEKIIEYLQ